MKIVSFESVTFHIGQNCSENDNLFMSMPENSVWFHLDTSTSSHVYAVTTNKKLNKQEIKKGAELVKLYSKKSGKVIYIQKNKLKRVGPGLIDILGEPKYA